MDRNALLIREQIDSGTILIAELRNRGIEIATAFWAWLSEAEAWYLYLACPGVDETGVRPVYLAIHGSLDRIVELGIDIFSIRVIGVRDPMAVDAARVIEPRVASGPFAVTPPKPFPGITNYGGSSLGGVPVDGVLVYPRNLAPLSAQSGQR